MCSKMWVCASLLLLNVPYCTRTYIDAQLLHIDAHWCISPTLRPAVSRLHLIIIIIIIIIIIFIETRLQNKFGIIKKYRWLC